MSKSLAYKHYLRALARWPKDPLRPECQFQDAMRRRIDRRFLPATTTDATNTTQAAAFRAPDEKAELEQVNALYSLLENRYSTRYRLTGSLMKPASDPTHYEDLVKELEAAPTRSVWGRLANKFRGFIRFS